MKTRVLDAVGFIGRFFADYGHEDDFELELNEALLDQGFSDSEVKEAYRWIEEKTLGAGIVKRGQGKNLSPSLRILSHYEKMKISPEAYGLLIDLHARGVLDLLLVEEILSRAMTLQKSTVAPSDIRRLAALTVFSNMQEDWADLMESSNNILH